MLEVEVIADPAAAVSAWGGLTVATAGTYVVSPSALGPVAADCAAFTRDLSDAFTSLVARYHDETTPRGRSHRWVEKEFLVPGRPE